MPTPFFPDIPGLGWGIKRSPHWDGLLIQTAASGIESRMQQWSSPKYEWELTFNYLRMYASYIEAQTLMGFYNSTFGGLLSFFFRDQNFNSVLAQPIGVGDGSTAQFQAQVTIGAFPEPVSGFDTRGAATYGTYSRPASVTQRAYVNGSPASAGFNNETGVITFSSVPGFGTTLTADFSYVYRCRFSDTKIDFELLFNQTYDANSIKIIQCFS